MLANNIPGDFVECGTWRGGLAALMLQHIIPAGVGKKIYIYDTFEGMPEPGDKDHPEALKRFNEKKDGQYSDWCRAGIETVQGTLEQVDKSYDKYVILIAGLVEKTLDITTPEIIALCRLDTDWYESTKKEMDVLYPKVSKGGIVLVDDYSDWPGCKLAVDEYLSNLDPNSYSKSIEDGSLVIHKR